MISQVQKSQGPAQGYKPGFLETVTCKQKQQNEKAESFVSEHSLSPFLEDLG